MDESEKSYYNPISTKEKQQLMKGLGKSNRPIILQKGSHISANSMILGGDTTQVRVKDIPELKIQSYDEVSFVVVYDSNKYWFRGKVEKFEGYLIFGSAVEVKKIQRRANFRAPVLGKSKVELYMQDYDSQAFNKSFSVLDISYGGCQFEVNGTAFPFSEGGRFSGEIQSSELANPLPVKGVIRRVLKNEEHGFMRVGVQFDDHVRGVETPLMDLIMRCARESQKYTAT